MKCRITGKEFEITEAERAHIKQLSLAHPLFNGDLPLPDIEPMEFLRQFAAWGNVISLFRNQSDFSGQHQLSRYPPELGYKICTPDEFWSQKVDNIEAGRDYDFNRPFFEQFNDLLHQVYFLALSAPNCEGSDYVNGANGAKNCYLCFGVFSSQDCLYCYMVKNSESCVDCVDIVGSQFCYDSFILRKCYSCRSCKLCFNCTECINCEDCIGCSNCIFSFGLRNQSYCIRNKTVSKEQYEAYLLSLSLSVRSNVEKEKRLFQQELSSANYRPNTLVSCEDSSGYCLTNSKNVYKSFFTHTAKDCGYLILSHDSKDAWRGVSESAELSYQASGYFNAYGSYNCYTDFGGNFNLYSAFLYNGCAHCFGCCGLNKKSYCILNKQYSKDEYIQLASRIINQMTAHNEWGQFFPPSLSPVPFEIAFANDWMPPIDSRVAQARGYNVTPVDDKGSSPDGISAESVPDALEDITDDILGKVLLCPKTKRGFKIQKKELDFYRSLGIPVPTRHWKERILSKSIGTMNEANIQIV